MGLETVSGPRGSSDRYSRGPSHIGPGRIGAGEGVRFELTHSAPGGQGMTHAGSRVLLPCGAPFPVQIKMSPARGGSADQGFNGVTPASAQK
jgi:hypothetical protein